MDDCEGGGAKTPKGVRQSLKIQRKNSLIER
jgi:hypothetical protein